MDFDDYYVGKIPIPKKKVNQTPYMKLANKMIVLNKQKSELLALFEEYLKKFRQDRESRPFKGYIDIKTIREREKTKSLEDFSDDKEKRGGYSIDLLESEEIIDYKEKGQVAEIRIGEEEDFLILSIRSENEETFRDMIRVKFTDKKIKQYFLLAIQLFLDRHGKKKLWSSEKIFEILDNIMIPRSVPNVDSDMSNIINMMKDFEGKYKEIIKSRYKDSPVKSISIIELEKEIKKTDEEIDNLIFDLYNLSDEEIERVRSA